MHRLPTSLSLLLLLLTSPSTLPDSPIQFRNITTPAGIQFTHTDGSSGQRYIVETVASGLALLDIDNDHHLDILFLNGQPLPGAPTNPLPPSCVLYRNNRNLTFTNLTESSGLNLPGYAMACAAADYNRDGFEDLLITYFGFQRLFKNNGNSTFTDVTRAAGLETTNTHDWIGAGCLFLDYDRDGHLDLFTSWYLQFDITSHKPLIRANIPSYYNPRNYPPVPSRLFRNLGNGTFQDVSQPAGIAPHKGYGMGVVASDFDDDGWLDIFVGNDVMENFLFHNKRNGTFEEIGVTSGVGYDQYGDPQGTMGVNAADYDNDGRFDIVLTDYQDQVTTLYRNLGNLQFLDVTTTTGSGINSRSRVKWGCGLVDFNNDGTLELFTAAGHLQDTIEQLDRTSTYKQRSLLLQQRNGRFQEITPHSGDLHQMIQSSRGATFGDLNNDGLIDIVVLNSRAPAAVFLNTTSTSNHWSLLKLTGARSSRSAIGARARLTAGPLTLVNEVRAGRSYQSAEDLRLHFGLGTNTTIDRLEIRWPNGNTNSWSNLPANQLLLLTEDNPVAGRAEAGPSQ